ncbi:c-type cytochrome domain-containing protein [Arenibacter certesii]|uniref:Cytochrome C Planctomycete-type domain-containing protein n=1 Tax=Arenibacter certesii TaxID=228955 RepID=A0A918J637_9FLAO|nr:c-type cytochrome domain-containing protein [Arenibacter certesii]GGW49451.1 hypothetical protein GCM10007383_36690 [Arenibacter certesii]
MEVIQQLLGRLHPIVVHLPIGFIVTGLLLQWFDRKNNEWGKIIAIIFQWGFISAALACISGYLLYIGEGYSFDTVKFHLWLGVATAVFSLLMFLRLVNPSKVDFLKRLPVVLISFSLFFIISITGHLGGNITHGSDYLIEPLPTSIKSFLGIGPENHEIPILDEKNWEDAVLYADLVQPILNTKCVSCHNSKKDRGDLQLHEGQGILNGGENGLVIEANDPENSSLYARLVLPLDHDDHMPPKDKTQLSKDEINIIKIWIANSNSFDKKIGELGLKKELFTAFFQKTNESIYPEIEVASASIDSIEVLKARGLHVEPLSDGNNFLKVSCINSPKFSDNDVRLLSPIFDQTVHLDLGKTEITDEVFELLSQFSNLTVLKLNNTTITGKNIEKLKGLEHLKILNLTHTNFDEEQFSILSSLDQLQTVYMYNTSISKNAKDKIIGTTEYNFGGYELPISATDSIVY